MTHRYYDPTSRLPYAVTQSTQDRYASPENYLEIEVNDPRTHGIGKNMYTDYEIICRTNLPFFKSHSSTVRRRYSEFEWLRSVLERENPRVHVPPLPGKTLFSNRFDHATIESRVRSLQSFLQSVCSHPLLQTGPASGFLISFIQDPNFTKTTLD